MCNKIIEKDEDFNSKKESDLKLKILNFKGIR